MAGRIVRLLVFIKEVIIVRNEIVNQKGQRKIALIVVVIALAIGWSFLLAPGTTGSEKEYYFTILHTNDEHSALLPSPFVDFHPEEKDPTVGGFARLSQLVNEIRAVKGGEGEPVMLISAGDFVGGSPYSWLIVDGEAPELSIMQQIGYDVVTIGNHEFDYGDEALSRYFQAAGYPEASGKTAVVSSNLNIPAGHPLANVGIKDVLVVTLDHGLKLGYFGLLGSDAGELAAKKDPVAVIEPIAAASLAVETLQEMEVDVIIAVTHAGLEEDRALAGAVPGIDVIVSGHCHTALHEPILVGNTVIVQSGIRLQYLGVLELAYSPDDGSVRVRNKESGRPFLLAIDDAITIDPVISETIDIYTEKINDRVRQLTGGLINHITESIFYSDFILRAGPPLQEAPFGNFVTDAMRLVVEEKTGEKVDFAFQANGVIRGDVVPGVMDYSLNRVSFYDLASTIGLGDGYDNNPGYPLVSVYLTGDEIYRVLELTAILSEFFGDTFFMQTSGLRYTYDRDRAILFRAPLLNLPVPSFRAVLEVEQFIGSGLQGDNPAEYRPITRGDDTLYHVVSDYYVLSFLPLIEERLPFYTVDPKNSAGEPTAIKEGIIYSGDGELKLWQAVVEYALSQPSGEDGIARVPDYYSTTSGRINQTQAFPLLVWPALALLFLALVMVLLLRRRRSKQG